MKKTDCIIIEIPIVLELELITIKSNRKDMRVNENIKPISCVYFLYDEYKQLQYIGESGNVRMRLHWHLAYGCTPTFVRIFPVSNKYDRKAIENLLIKKYQPLKNII